MVRALCNAPMDFFGTPIFIFLPLIITKYVNGGSAQYGIMQFLMGAGTIAASVMLSFTPEPKKKFLTMASSLLIMGFFLAIGNVMQNVILQRNSPKKIRGRVFSFRSTLNSGLRPVSYGVAGLISLFFPVSLILLCLGILSGLCSFAFFIKGRMELVH